MKAVMQKTLPIALAALLTACGGGSSGGSSDPLEPLTYSGKATDAQTTEANKEAIAKEVVDFARAFVTVSRFQTTEQSYLYIGNDPAAFWFDEDLYDEDLSCSTGTYKSSITFKDEDVDDVDEVNFNASLDKCVVDLDGDIFTYTGKLNYLEYKDTNSDFNLYKENYEYDMKISFDGTTLDKKSRRIDETYNDHKGEGAGDWHTNMITTVIKIFGKTYKYTNDKDISYTKGLSGKIYKSENLEAYDYDDDEYYLENTTGTPYVYLPGFGKMIIGMYTGDRLSLCENDNFENGVISVKGLYNDSAILEIKFTDCGKYSVRAIQEY